MEWLDQQTILLTICGSHAYGLSTENSDLDIKTIVIAPAKYHLGFQNEFKVSNKPTHIENYRKYLPIELQNRKLDGTIFEIKEFLRQASNGNPNIYDLLFFKDGNLIENNKFGNKILENRDLFVTKYLKNKFVGYASSDLKYIKENRNEPDKELYKRSMHMIRILRVCKEALSTGQVNIYRTNDREELFGIRQGFWSIDKILSYAKILNEEIEELYNTSTVIPDKPDFDKLDELCQNLVYQNLFK